MPNTENQVAAQAAFEPFYVYLPGEYPMTGAAVFIERDSDHLIFDANGDKKFKADTGLTTQYLPLVPGTGSFAGRQSARILLDPAQFKDGDYIVNYIRNDIPTKPIFSMAVFTVINGSAATPLITLDSIAEAIVSKLPTSSGGSAPTAVQNATAVMNFPYKTVTAPGSVAAVMSANYTLLTTVASSVSSLPSANVIATAFLKSSYKSVTDAGSVGSVLNGIYTSQIAAAGKFSSIDSSVANVNTRITNLATKVDTLTAGQSIVQTSQTAMATKMSALQYDMSNIASRMNNVSSKLGDLFKGQTTTNTTLSTLQAQLKALSDSVAQMKVNSSTK